MDFELKESYPKNYVMSLASLAVPEWHGIVVVQQMRKALIPGDMTYRHIIHFRQLMITPYAR
jgi:hypothetical protein